MKLIYDQSFNRLFPFYREKWKLKDVSGLHPCYLQKEMISISLLPTVLWWWNKCMFIEVYLHFKVRHTKKEYHKVLSHSLQYEFSLLIRKVITIFLFSFFFFYHCVFFLAPWHFAPQPNYKNTTFPQRLRKTIYMMEVFPEKSPSHLFLCSLKFRCIYS